MRFVAGRGAVAESHRESAAGRGAVAESHRESAAGRNAVAELHREANKRTQKEKGPKETLISLSDHSYLLLRKLTAADPVYECPEYEHRANEAC